MIRYRPIYVSFALAPPLPDDRPVRCLGNDISHTRGIDRARRRARIGWLFKRTFRSPRLRVSEYHPAAAKDERNSPNRKIFDHFFAMGVTWKQVTARDPGGTVL